MSGSPQPSCLKPGTSTRRSVVRWISNSKRLGSASWGSRRQPYVSARSPMRLIGGVMCSGAAPNANTAGLGCGQHPTPWQCSPATCRWNKGSPATPHSNNTPRHFDGWLGQLIRLRDQTCTDPYCDAPIRHLDHIIRHSDDGPTTLENARGTCERGNYVREMPGLAHQPHRLRLPQRAAHHITTPTGHHYVRRAPTHPEPEPNCCHVAISRSLPDARPS